MFYDKFEALCVKKGVTPNKACLDMGLSRSVAAKWKNTGNNPRSDVLTKVAAYFGVTTSDLLGEDTKKDPAQSAEPKTNEFINLYASLSPEQQAKVEAFAKFLQMEGKE